MNLASTRAAEGFPRRAFNVDEIRRMTEAGILDEGENFELIGGDLVVMPPRYAAHEFIKSALSMALLRWAPNEVIVAVASTLQLANDVLVEPDIAILPESVYAGDPKSYAQPGPEGVPLLIEIAVSSMAYDRDFKARLYAHLGIHELWVIDATERVTWIYTAPSGDTWRSVIERGPTDALITPSLPGFSIRLGDIG